MDAREAFSQRMFEATLSAFEVMSVYVGGKLGLYDSLHREGPATPLQLAERVGIAERYAKEWLEQQAVSGVLGYEQLDPSIRRFHLPAEHAEPLLDPESPYAIEPLIRFYVPIPQVMPQLLEAYRTGGGVDWADFGTDVIEAQGDFNRGWLMSSFATQYLPSLDDVHRRLSDETTPARVADVACGTGWAAIAIALGYPHARVDGLDLDEHSIELARKYAADAGVSDRVSFGVRDASDPMNAGEYDLAVIIESVHDLSDPVGVLRAMRTMLKPGGVALVADEKVAGSFVAPGDEVERIMYAFSLMCCLPAGMASRPSAETGTVMRPETLYAYASQAGFKDAGEVSEIDHPLLRFYRLDP